MSAKPEDLYVVLVSPHGLIRGQELELGRDADTGGQTKYVVELARALARRPEVARVDLLTRLVDDPEVADDYARPEEPLCEGARIVRVPCGEAGYLPKEQLWDHLEAFADNALKYLNDQPVRPSLIHSHYADAGHVGIQLSTLLTVPLVHTGHSLGRTKRKRLLASGLNAAEIETTYNMGRRIDAEERTLGAANLVVVSTHQEIEEQYGLYDYYRPDQMRVVPPGTDLEKFMPPRGDEWRQPVAQELSRFLAEPRKPIVLALSRPDPRKNIATLVEAYGESPHLQELANLVIVAGNRDDIRDLEEGARGVLSGVLLAIDRYDLYGKVAFPKHHRADDVPLFYRLAARSRGVFVNPALTEPFGLTLLEAAACGLPVVATEDGGPRDIIGNCDNGLLVDPLDREAMAEALCRVIGDEDAWPRYAANGLAGVREHYSWEAHAEKYLAEIAPVVGGQAPLEIPDVARREQVYRDRAIITDLDQNLLGDKASVGPLMDLLYRHRKEVSFGVATGRGLRSALAVMRRNGIRRPDLLITNLGTEIHYGPSLSPDTIWRRHIDHGWSRDRIKEVMADLPGLARQEKEKQGTFKLSWYWDEADAPPPEEIQRLLQQADQNVNVIFSHGQYVDIVPYRASKGFALRWAAGRVGIPVENMLVAGGSGADEDMMRGNTRAVVVGNRHDEELSGLVEADRIYFAQKSYAAGIVEAIDHYAFLSGRGGADA